MMVNKIISALESLNIEIYIFFYPIPFFGGAVWK